MTHRQIGFIKDHVGPRVLNRSRGHGVPVVVRVERVGVGLEGIVVVAVVVIVAVGEIFAAGVKRVVSVFEVETKARSDLTTFQEEASRCEIGSVFLGGKK